MATANPTPSDRGEDNFLLELGRVRKQIKDTFVELLDCMKARECELLKELDLIVASYCSYQEEIQKPKEEKKNSRENESDFRSRNAEFSS